MQATYCLYECLQGIVPRPTSVDPDTIFVLWGNGKSITMYPVDEDRVYFLGEVLQLQLPSPKVGKVFVDSFSRLFSTFTGHGFGDVMQKIKLVRFISTFLSFPPVCIIFLSHCWHVLVLWLSTVLWP